MRESRAARSPSLPISSSGRLVLMNNRRIQSMKKIAMLIGFIIVASACVAVAGAQTSFREFNAESRGRGVIRLENQRDEDITNASIALRRNGDAEIRLF